MNASEIKKFTDPREIPFKVLKDRRDFVTEIIDRVSKGKGIWDKDWNISFLRPEREDSGKTFKGKNRYKLGITTAKNGFNDNRWYTFNEVQELQNKLGIRSIHVERGSTSTKVDFSKTSTLEEIRKEYEKSLIKQIAKRDKISPKEVVLTEEDKNRIENKVNQKLNLEKMVTISGKKVFFDFQTSNLFNAKQIANLPQKEVKEKRNSEKQISKMIDTLAESCSFPVKFSSEENTEGKNGIFLPSREDFGSEKECLATLLHKICHFTENDSKNDYLNNPAMKELKSAFTNLFIQSDLGINLANESKIDNNQEYVNYWKQQLIKYPKNFDDILNESEKRAKTIIKAYQEVLQKNEEEKIKGFSTKEEKAFVEKPKEKTYIKPETKPKEKPIVENEKPVIEEKKDTVKSVKEVEIENDFPELPENKPLVEIAEEVKEAEEEIKHEYIYGTPEDVEYLVDEYIEKGSLIDPVEQWFEVNDRYLSKFMKDIELKDERINLSKSEMEEIEEKGVSKFIEDNKESIQKRMSNKVAEKIKNLVDEIYDGNKIPVFADRRFKIDDEYIKTKLRVSFKDKYLKDSPSGKRIKFDELIKKTFTERKAKIKAMEEKHKKLRGEGEGSQSQ